MQPNPYILPVKRYGNERNPKLIILLCNPGDDPIKCERLPDYTMYLDGKYKEAGLSLDVAYKYNEWWDEFFTVFKQAKLKPSDVLVLEYYPYHTCDMSLVPNYNQWTDYAKNALSENKKLLNKFMSKNVPVFGYYYSHWLREVPELKNYKLFYKSRARFKNRKIKELHQFLKEVL
jgi:hypothetical protein